MMESFACQSVVRWILDSVDNTRCNSEPNFCLSVQRPEKSCAKSLFQLTRDIAPENVPIVIDTLYIYAIDFQRARIHKNLDTNTP